MRDFFTLYLAPEDGGAGGAPAGAPAGAAASGPSFLAPGNAARLDALEADALARIGGAKQVAAAIPAGRGSLANAAPDGSGLLDPFAGEAGTAPAPAPGAPNLNAKAEIQRLMTDPEFQAKLNNREPRIRQPAMEAWEALHMAAAGTPDAVAAHKTTPLDNDAAILEAQIGPKAASEYAFTPPKGFDLDPGMDQFRQDAFASGIAPQIANQLWRDAPRIEAMPDEAHTAQCQNACSVVRAMPGGQETLQAAARMCARFEARGPLWARAMQVAITQPAALLELARLDRRAGRG